MGAPPGEGSGKGGGKLSAPAKGEAKGKGKAAGRPAGGWKATAVKAIKLPDDNKDVLASFKALDAHSRDELACIDWSQMRDVGVITGSLEIEEALTGIAVADVAGKLLGIRNICMGRFPMPVQEYFAMALNQALAETGETNCPRLAELRLLHRGSADNEYTKAWAGLRGCIQSRTGLQGLTEDEHDPDAWLAKNPGFTDMQHSVVRLIKIFFTAPKTQPSFTAIMEMVPGLQTIQDKMTMRDEISINKALGQSRGDESYVHRGHESPLFASEDEAVRGRMLLELGRLTAFDALLNNWDRVGLKLLWDNKGNLTNVCVERGTLRLVGIDQAVQVITPGPGLDTYRRRLAATVHFMRRMERSDFVDKELEELDAAADADDIIAGYYVHESKREAMEQAAIMGRRTAENPWEGRTEAAAHLIEMTPAAALQDIVMSLYNFTGVFFKLGFVAQYFVRGMAEGFQHFVSVDLDGLFPKVGEEVRTAFARTEDVVVDLETNIARCVDFVRGNMEVVQSGPSLAAELKSSGGVFSPSTRPTRAEEREVYVKEKLAPFLEPLAAACLRGGPADCAGYMVAWLRARIAGAAEPPVVGAKSQLTREEFASKSVAPLLEPMVAEVLRDMPADPLAEMVEYLEKSGGRAQAQDGLEDVGHAKATARKSIDAAMLRPSS